jgi:twitching motility protein PilT
MARIDTFLKLGLEQGCSDVHLAVGAPPMLRMNGEIIPIKFRDLRPLELEGYLNEILIASQLERFKKGEDLDFSYVADEVGRFRVAVYRKLGGVGVAFRYIPSRIPSIDELQLPPIVERLTEHRQGLILLTGATGTGKSTTLAAMIDRINSSRACNILTLEDPVEFVHGGKQAQIVQREVGTHVPSFADGLRSGLREDPDVILVGELRDAETVGMAMTAAETGHLVLATLHTTSATKTVDRFIDALPAEQREQARIFLAQNLHAVISQVLVKRANGQGRKAILEVMIVNQAISRLIATDKIHQIPSQIQTGRDQGMQLLDDALLAAVKENVLDPDDAYRFANDKRGLQRFVTDASVLPKLELAGG